MNNIRCLTGKMSVSDVYQNAILLTRERRGMVSTPPWSRSQTYDLRRTKRHLSGEHSRGNSRHPHMDRASTCSLQVHERFDFSQRFFFRLPQQSKMAGAKFDAHMAAIRAGEDLTRFEWTEDETTAEIVLPLVVASIDHGHLPEETFAPFEFVWEPAHIAALLFTAMASRPPSPLAEYYRLRHLAELIWENEFENDADPLAEYAMLAYCNARSFRRYADACVEALAGGDVRKRWCSSLYEKAEEAWRAHLWSRLRAFVRTRAIFWYWHGLTAHLHAPGGAYHATDRAHASVLLATFLHKSEENHDCVA